MLKYPNFFVIGCQRCGTTWLYEALKQHSQVYLPKEKELHFFDWNHDKGWDWYKSFYEGVESEIAIGEITPSYIYNQEACLELYNNFPEAKLILVVRNPVERAFSQYLRHKNALLFNLSFEEAIIEYPHLIKRGLYYQQLLKYIEKFPKSKIKVLVYENLISAPKTYMNELLEFLGVEKEDITTIIQSQKVNQARHYRSESLHKFIMYTKETLKSIGFQFLISLSLNLGLKKILYTYFTVPGYSKDMILSNETKIKIFDRYFKEDVTKFSELIDHDLLKLWRYELH
jgi:hypothetical protein